MTRLLLLAALAAATSVTIVGGSARANGTACPAANAPNELVLVGGSGQTGQLGKPFAQSFQVALANSNGCPLTGNLAGVTINFDAPGSGASGIFAGSASREAYVATDAQGIATAPPFTANYTAGSYTVDAHSDYGTIELFLSNTAAGLPAGISAGTGTPQQATVNSRYAQPLQVRVTDASGNPVQGAAVSFSIVPGSTGAGASFLGGPANPVTDSNGVATSLPLLANGTPGAFQVVASADGISGVATFSLDNHAAAAKLTAGEPAQSATVHTRYGRPLTARVVDASGLPVEGAAITFSLGSAAGGGGASGPDAAFAGGSSQATVLSDQNGQATSPPFTAGDTPGGFTATATAAGAPDPVSYRLQNLPARLTASSRIRRASVGHRMRSPLVARVTDMHGRPVDGATVVFTIGKSSAGATASFADGTVQATVTSGAGGRAIAPALAANTIAGTFAVTAAMPGGASIRYTLTNDAGAPASIAVGAASGQSLPVRSQLPLRLAVTVTDADGNPVAGTIVSFAAPSSGPGGSFATRHHPRVVRVVTNRRGVALAPAFRANAQAGGYAVTVHAGGVRAGFALVNTIR
jgi:protocatechuate 3,4-dioxygenase beta subunit